MNNSAELNLHSYFVFGGLFCCVSGRFVIFLVSLMEFFYLPLTS